MLWEIEIYAAEGQIDRLATDARQHAASLGIGTDSHGHGPKIVAARGYLLEGELSPEEAQRAAAELLADSVVERPVISKVSEPGSPEPFAGAHCVYVLPKPGVTDSVAKSAQGALADIGIHPTAMRTFRKYWFGDLPQADVQALSQRVLANQSIEEISYGPLNLQELAVGTAYNFKLETADICQASDEALMKISQDWVLSLSLVEMHTIAAHFRELGREPTVVELETIAQTWSEHCSHKTLAGKIAYTDETGLHEYNNMLKETIFAATQQLRQQWGEHDWCVSVFRDNAGVVSFDGIDNVTFKVETHNRPSAIEPYGGAGTGIGGVIRDTLGTGLAAKPIANTDVFCFAPPDKTMAELPPGVLHPARVMDGVVAGVRDYGNRMGIPTVNGAIYYDERYVGNPLVFCGSVGILPHEKSFGHPHEGDLIVAIGGRTGRDGIHGATFSSAELNEESEITSSGAVQIGNAITEKMFTDVLLEARDRGLYNAVTDCGAGGFSSAVGEMAEELGAEVWLDKAPLKYAGLSYTEIWISEAQERMVLSVPEAKWPELEELCNSEAVEATVLGRFEKTGQLVLKYGEHQVADLSLAFMHDGRPPIVREAIYTPPAVQAFGPAEKLGEMKAGDVLLKLLASRNIASKEDVIRQYDHEVQGGSVIKPLCGVAQDGPSDAAVIRPKLESYRGLVISCGMNPKYGDFDTYHMAASGIDEAIRNCVAVGADPSRIAILDNFCWGRTDRPETLGSLVRAARACHDLALVMETPFISGKDSLHNEFKYTSDGVDHAIAIPPTLLISALGQVQDVRKCVTMDLKKAGNPLYVVGVTKAEFGGSHLGLVTGLSGGQVPTVNPAVAKQTFHALHAAISAGCVASCHDLSEGGLAVAAAEMAFAGELGLEIDIAKVPLAGDIDGALATWTAMFSESNSRFLCEVPADKVSEFEAKLAGVTFAQIGTVVPGDSLNISLNNSSGDQSLVHQRLVDLKAAWQTPLKVKR